MICILLINGWLKRKHMNVSKKIFCILVLLGVGLVVGFCEAKPAHHYGAHEKKVVATTAAPSSMVENVVNDLYAAYLLNPSQDLFKDYFTSDFYQQIVKQQKIDAVDPEMGCINGFDLLFNAQDSPAKFVIKKAEVDKKDPGHARVSVALDFGRATPTYVDLALVKINNVWRIDNIFYPENQKDLRAMIRAC
jgi:hypothetical protein